MGYRTVRNVPRTTNYANALAVYNSVTPIRGSDNVRPLGARRDHNTYHVRLTTEGVVEYVLYRTPVVKFFPDGAVSIQNGGYASQATHQFIWQVLGIEACGFQNKSKLKFADDSIYLLRAEEELELARDEHGRFMAATPQELKGYSMNRKAANNVRRRFKEFADYLDGTVKLRKEEIVMDSPYASARWSTERINIYYSELIEVLGLRAGTVNNYGATMLETKFTYIAVPVTSRHKWYYKDMKNVKPAQVALFLSLITSDQPEETKHDNFYKAFLALCVGERDLWIDPKVIDGKQLTANPETVIEMYNKALMMAHAREVLEVTMLPPGKTPNPKYQGWIEDEDQDK